MPEIEGRGRNAYETVDAGGTFFVHLSDILLPYHKVSYIGGIHKPCDMEREVSKKFIYYISI